MSDSARLGDTQVTSSRGHIVRVQPAGVEIVVEPGETIFDSAYREGYDWPTICGGQATCTHCHVRILEGLENVSDVQVEHERRGIKRLAQRLYGGDPTGVRLACQVEVSGEVVVEQSVFDGERLPNR